MPRVSQPESRRHRKHRGDYEGDEYRKSRHGLRTRTKILLLATPVFLIILGTFLFVLLADTDRVEEKTAHIPTTTQFKKAFISRMEPLSRKDSVTMVGQALLLRDVGKVGDYFRTGSANPASVISFLEGMAKSDGPVKNLEWFSSLNHNGLLIEAVSIRTVNGNTPKERLALMTPDTEGNWKIDFDAFARTVRPSWDLLINPNSSGGLVRVSIKDDNYYNRAFSDDTTWTCYQGVSADTDMQLYCYCKRNSPQHKALKQILANNRTENGDSSLARVVLELRRVENCDARQFEVSNVVAEDWIVSSVQFDDHFR